MACTVELGYAGGKVAQRSTRREFFNLERNKLSLKHVMKNVISMPHKRYSFLLRKSVTLVS